MEKLPEDRNALVRAEVDALRRDRIKKHHTATHLLHAVLRQILGPHVAQKGSLVAPDRLRFDFSHYERVLPVQLKDIEAQVNEAIQRNIARQEERHVPRDEALSRGAMALFGEKYGDFVRVITFAPDFSVELCGGAHVDATGEIGLFRFVSESSVAAGVRRIEAVTGRDALDLVNAQIDELERARGHFRTLSRPLDEEIADLLAQAKERERELQGMRQQNLQGGLDALIQQARQVGPVRVVAGRVPDTGMESLRTLGQTLGDRLGDGAVGVLGTVDPEGEKVYLVASVSEDLLTSSNLKAGALVGALAKRVGGGGGGRPNLATAGGRQPENLDAALDAAPDVVREML